MELSLGTKEIIVAFEEYGARFVCTPLSTRELEQLEKRHTKTLRRGQGSEQKTDAVAMGEERFIKTVKSWEGLTNGGTPLECNLVNKKKIYQHHMTLVARIFEELEASEEEEMGNSPISLNSELEENSG